MHLLALAGLLLASTPLFQAADRAEGPAQGPAQRVEIARDALRSGRLADALAELDRVLAADPDCLAARRCVAEAPLALTLPAGPERPLAERLVLFGARAKPALRELAATRLAALPRVDSDPVVARSLRSPSATVRAFAAFAARRIEPKAYADALVRRCVVDPVDSVRLEAARALRDAADDALAGRVASALDLPDARVRVFAAGSLAEMGYRSAVPPLATRLAALAGSHPGGTRAHIRVGSQVAYVQDFNPEIAQGASIADPIINVVEDATVLDVRVGGTSVQTIEAEGPSICRALARLSGETLPEKTSAWLDWWKQNARRFERP
jgi:hypothetical protein